MAYNSVFAKFNISSPNGSKDFIKEEVVRSIYLLRAWSASLALGLIFGAEAVELPYASLTIEAPQFQAAGHL